MTFTTSTADKIRDLNDEFRQLGPAKGRDKFDGLWLTTAGVQAEGLLFTGAAILAVRHFDAFTEDNDPHGEHDFGAIDIHSKRVFWKIDYLQRGAQFGADDRADNTATCRVITIMLAEEW
jgi:hypothetical protein